MFLDNGVDASAIEWVSVGYDPTILPNGQVQGLGAYKSNEPKALARKGFEVVEWDPASYGIKSSFNTQIANSEFAAAHPTVIEDFLRASFKAFDWINESDANLDTALGYAAALSDAGYDLESSKVRWQTEIELINASQPEGTPVGWQSAEQWQPEADMLLRFELIKAPADAATAQSNAFVAAISSGADLVWPAP
jgi:putative hydroxymethylpyrimidine transport system substrate-binding protein